MTVTFIIGAFNSLTPQDLQRNSIQMVLCSGLERPVERPEEKIVGLRAQYFGGFQFLGRRTEEIQLLVFFLGTQLFQSSALLRGQCRIFNAQISQFLRQAHHNAVRAVVAETALNPSIEQVEQVTKSLLCKPFLNGKVEARLIDRTNKPVLDHKPHTKSLPSSRPVSVSCRVALPCRNELVQPSQPGPCRSHIRRGANKRKPHFMDAACIRAGPAFARTRRGSSPVLPSPNASLGSGRHSIENPSKSLNKPCSADFDGQELPLKDQIIDVILTDVDRRPAFAQEPTPECQVVLNILVAVELYAAGCA